MGYDWPPKKKKKAHKFNLDPNAPRTSKLERAVYQILLLREKSGEIKDIECQRSVELGTETFTSARSGAVKTRKVKWKPDFSFTIVKTGSRVWCEAKGVETRLYRKQLNLWRGGAGPGDLEIWKGDYRRPYLSEIVRPITKRR